MPRIGIFGLSGCWGEQIVILNCEDEILDLAANAEIVDFPGGSSANDREGPLDVALVEGSVGSDRDERSLRAIRERSGLLVACGSCACFGGVPAAVRGACWPALAAEVYGPHASDYDIQPHRPLHDLVRVDAALPGCPMEKEEFLLAMASLLNGDLPVPIRHPVCLECRARELQCLLVTRGLPCAGPVTAAGCRARCPAHRVPCIGCRGPSEEANLPALLEALADTRPDTAELRRKLITFARPVISGTPEERTR